MKDNEKLHRKEIRKMIKVGDKIEIEYMDGEPSYSGRIGIVTSIDDAGQIHGTWGGCALLECDEFKVIEKAKER